MKENSFPWHASASDSLELELFVPPLQTIQFSEAFSVHPPNELPMLLHSSRVFEFSGGRHIEVLITPSAIRSDENLKMLKPSDRLCYFEGEKQLKFFKVYTKRNCEIECHAKIIESLEGCRCVAYDIVRGPDARVCGTLEFWCDNRNERKIYQNFDLTPCNCLPPCNSVSYEISITESKLREKE